MGRCPQGTPPRSRALDMAGLRVAELSAQTRLEVWSSSSSMLGNENTCIVCQQKFENGEILRVVTSQQLPCLHSFHASCLEKWLGKNTSWPTCRANLRLPDLAGP